MNQNTRIETLGPIEFIGITLFGNPETTSFHSAWEYFGTIADDASISRIGQDLYGLQIYHPVFSKIFKLSYMAYIEKKNNMEIPIRMFSKILKESKYVVQKVEGGIRGID